MLVSAHITKRAHEGRPLIPRHAKGCHMTSDPQSALGSMRTLPFEPTLDIVREIRHQHEHKTKQLND
ncbi:hypothetical protein PENSOL_c001G00656 [Penicillium solitum]|uniref:Uncharacterized protein n=1 Tax=Penicillium solitum TaxID=60172 RepID=A0A1V6RP05_9EURO|nr:uncharacterized protein PENSOL_c001G00656 [Penicillium solitum]OQE03501.1 hypothetical protein PENSOL_c001G00656 [Penicillium solitum]